jgi:hypothetical protein
MTHLDAIAGRLPQIYREGPVLGGLLGAPALQIEILDEILLEVSRAHWFDTTLELAEAARLAAVLDIAPEPWHDLPLFRVWVNSLRDAMLDWGAVTPHAIEAFVAEYVSGFERARRVQIVWPTGDFADRSSASQPALVENPPVRAWARPGADGLVPLSQFAWVNGGLEASEAALLLVGLPEGPEFAPMLVNLTTGRALIYLGAIGPGQRLEIRPDGKGGVRAFLEGDDVTARLRSIAGVAPGTPWSAAQIDATPTPLAIVPGPNEMWFLPVAHYDVPGLDRFLLALPDLDLRDGRFDLAPLDHATFYAPPAVQLRATWLEKRPACFEVQLPAGTLLGEPGEPGKPSTAPAALRVRGELADSLDEAVDKLRAAGVRSSVKLRPFAERQGARDRLRAVLPMTVRERGPSGADALPDKGGVFLVTNFNESTFR